MTDDLKKTIRLQVPTKRSNGGSAATEEAELELISTQELHVLLEGDNDRRKDLEAVAESRDGVLARNIEDDQFHIVDQDEVAEALSRAEDARPLGITGTALADTDENGDKSLTLVSTMMLKSMLVPGEEESKPQAELSPLDNEIAEFKNGGFNPYNQG